MIVVKLGGAALKNSLNDSSLFKVLSKVKEPLVIVHGGGPEINALSQKLGFEAKFFEGQRVTDKNHMDVVEMVLSGKVNSALVRSGLKEGLRCVGLKGADDGMFQCQPEDAQLGQVGHVTKINDTLIKLLLSNHYVPVVSPVGFFNFNEPCNVNADLAASALASHLKATQLIFLTDRDGILDAQGDTLAQLSRQNLLNMLKEGSTISGGMKVKARAILETLEKVPSAKISVMNGTNWQQLEDSLIKGRSSGTQVI